MTITRYVSSSWRLAAGIVLAFAVGLVPVAAQQRQTLGRIEFVGLKRLTHDQVFHSSKPYFESKCLRIRGWCPISALLAEVGNF
jgi:hypothetical protein